MSTFPRTVDVSGGWEYDAARDEVVGRRGTFDGMTYAMQVEIPSLTKDDLADAEVGDPDDDGASLEVPQTSPHAGRRRPGARDHRRRRRPRTSRRWRSRRSSAPRRTSPTTPAWHPSRSDDAVWDFLQSTRGYCVQFATSMAIMARTLDIPARVAVGFLPGESDRNGSYVVTGQRSHAWPELYFEGYGWVRFEPTPAVQTERSAALGGPVHRGLRARQPARRDRPAARDRRPRRRPLRAGSPRRPARRTRTRPGCRSRSPSRSCWSSPRSAWRSSGAAASCAPT